MNVMETGEGEGLQELAANSTSTNHEHFCSLKRHTHHTQEKRHLKSSKRHERAIEDESKRREGWGYLNNLSGVKVRRGHWRKKKKWNSVRVVFVLCCVGKRRIVET